MKELTKKDIIFWAICKGLSIEQREKLVKKIMKKQAIKKILLRTLRGN